MAFPQLALGGTLTGGAPDRLGSQRSRPALALGAGATSRFVAAIAGPLGAVCKTKCAIPSVNDDQ